ATADCGLDACAGPAHACLRAAPGRTTTAGRHQASQPARAGAGTSRMERPGDCRGSAARRPRPRDLGDHGQPVCRDRWCAADACAGSLRRGRSGAGRSAGDPSGGPRDGAESAGIVHGQRDLPQLERARHSAGKVTGSVELCAGRRDPAASAALVQPRIFDGAGWMTEQSMRGRIWPRMLLLLVLLAVVAAAVFGWNDYHRFSVAPLNVTTQQESIDVSRGTSFKGIVAELRRHGLSTASPWYWRLLAEQMHVARQLLADMAAGKVLQRNFTIVDGWTFAELRQALAHAEKLRHDSSGLDDATIMQKIGAPGEVPEGRFLPETYAYVKGDGDLDILRRAHVAMVKTLAALWPCRD